jgi:transposase
VPKILKARPPHDDGEERKIRKLAGARHAPADWSERARIIALSWDGLAVPAIAGQLGCHPKKVRRWLHRFNADGIDGLGDRPGAGRRRRITEAQRSAVIALARSEPPGHLDRDGSGELSAGDEHGPAQWTLDALAQTARDAGIAIGRSQVRRILLAEKVRWRRTRSWATSTDPDFAPKAPLIGDGRVRGKFAGLRVSGWPGLLSVAGAGVQVRAARRVGFSRARLAVRVQAGAGGERVTAGCP